MTPESPRSGAESGAAPLRRHIPLRRQSYAPAPLKIKQPPRRHYPNLSPTRCPLVAADVALWPAWTDVSVELLNTDAFDSAGNPVLQEGGR